METVENIAGVLSRIDVVVVVVVSAQDEEDMLVDWFRLVQTKHQLVRRDAELVYL